jgi:hypothetical protein
MDTIYIFGFSLQCIREGFYQEGKEHLTLNNIITKEGKVPYGWDR